MTKRVTLVAAVLTLASTACSSDSVTTTSPTTIPTTTRAATTTLPPAKQPPVEAPLPPPASFSEIENDYLSAAEAIVAAGRRALDLFLADDFETLWQELDAPTAAMLSVEDLRAGREQLTEQAPLGNRTADRAIQLSPSLRIYGAQLEWGDEALVATVSLNGEGEISGLILTPEFPLPVDPSAGYHSDVDFRLPFEGLWFVFWGGDVELENYHVVAQDQRHALDLVVWKDGGTHRGDGTENVDYWAYGQKVIAPADGTVVSVVDGLADSLPQVETDTANPAGNHVVIEVGPGEYILIAHMLAGSLTVSEGDSVSQGQQVGLVGNSGNTSEPHIHIHLQDQPMFSPEATGLPLEFSSYLANGQAVERGEPTADQFIVNG